MKIQSREGQNVGDLCLQLYGDVSHVVAIARRNNLSLDTAATADTEVDDFLLERGNEKIYKYFYARATDIMQSKDVVEAGRTGDYNNDYNNDYDI